MDEKNRQVGSVNYQQGTVPDDYQCDYCKAHGVKLWRERRLEFSETRLLCTHCAEEDQEKFEYLGWKSDYVSGTGNQIGWFVPAIPAEGANAYHSHGAVPLAGINWWRNLPDKK